VLAHPKQPNVADIDIVAVHGLNPFKNTSNAASTWTSADGKMWLQDEGFLPTQIPNARIMLFGYNSNVAFTSSNAGLVQQATNLLLLLDLHRDVGCEILILYP
jgi:protein SERAC1